MFYGPISQKWSFLDDVGSWDEEQILRSNFHVHLAIGNVGEHGG
uniref:Uncharacterized protein n=1 Tax=Anguilla anguilla TaxID=7936 RepID=A0A0E9VP99_ANGAN